VNKSDKSSIFKSSLLVALLGTAFGAHAAGLGKLTVYSAIGQPLNAEVALTATPEELNGLSARLAPHSAFSDAGIDFMTALNGLRFEIAKMPDGQPVLRLTTAAPLNEPFLHFLVELNWTAGRMVREYTFLLDPPEMLQAAKPASIVAPVTPHERPAPRDVVPAPAAEVPAAALVRPVRSAAGEYRVVPGDTLSKIAREHKIETVSLDQMLVALFNSNRDVFDANNMNRLRAGRILRLPDAAEAAQVDAGEARKLVVSQAADFNAYRRRLAEAAGRAPAATDMPASQQATGRIEPQIEAKAPSAPVADKLEVSRTEAGKEAAAGGGERRLEEDLIAREKSLQEAAERIAQLEKNLENLKRLMELKSESAAQIQQQAEAVAAPQAVAESKPAAEKKPAEEQKPESSATPSDKPAPADPKPKPAVKKPLPPPPPPEPSFVEDNPELVFGGGGLIALLFGYFGYTAWRRKKLLRDARIADDHAAMAENDLSSRSGTVFGAASESVDNGEASIQGDFSEDGLLTTEENVDPVAEADVLMAYGRDSQAEEILKAGLKTDPTRGAIHLKLLELYANRKDIQQFEAVAGDLQALSHGSGPEWDKATALARSLGLAGGLFAAAAVTAVEPEPVELASAPQTIPEEVLPVEATNETVVLNAPVVPQEVAPSAEDDIGSLDFDLDLGSSAGAPAAEEPVEIGSVGEAGEGALDFDFDLGAIGSAAETAPAETAQPAATGDEIDFSLGEVEAPEVELAAPSVVAGADEAGFDLDLGSFGDAGDEPAGVAPLTPTPAATPNPALDLADISLDLDEPGPAGGVAVDVPLEEEVAGIDLSDIDLSADMDGGGAAEEGGVGSAREESVDDPEVATKLELAQAYEEMGDREGARELLNEVLGEGSEAQQALARTRIEQLDA
jgi:pilus assembly protein FimV